MQYDVNPVLSRFTLQVHAGGMLAALGHSPVIAIREFSGRVVLPEDASGTASMELVIRAASLRVADDVKESDRREIERTMNREILDVDRYPDITFAGTAPAGAAPGAGSQRVTITGTLSLRGVSRTQQIDALVNLMGDRLTANGQFRVRQGDYGIKPVSVAGGAIKLKDEIDLSFDIVARAAPAA